MIPEFTVWSRNSLNISGTVFSESLMHSYIHSMTVLIFKIIFTYLTVISQMSPCSVVMPNVVADMFASPGHLNNVLLFFPPPNITWNDMRVGDSFMFSVITVNVASNNAVCLYKWVLQVDNNCWWDTSHILDDFIRYLSIILSPKGICLL